ncbi:MAG: hypothetical protein AB7E95_03930 [Kiritimatiellales bacterium]
MKKFPPARAGLAAAGTTSGWRKSRSLAFPTLGMVRVIGVNAEIANSKIVVKTCGGGTLLW